MAVVRLLAACACVCRPCSVLMTHNHLKHVTLSSERERWRKGEETCYLVVDATVGVVVKYVCNDCKEVKDKGCLSSIVYVHPEAELAVELPS